MSGRTNCFPRHILLAFVQGELSDSVNSQVDAHLSQCPRCREEFDQLDQSRVAKPLPVGSDQPTCDYAGQVGTTPNARNPQVESLAPIGSGLKDVDGGRDEECPSQSMEVAQLLALQLLNPSTMSGSLGKLRDYEVVSILGQGGYGIVFEALDKVLDRRIAIKVLTPDLAHQAVSRRRFIREARAAAAINHPNVVTVYGVEEGGKFPFLIMELLRGKSLRERLRREPKLDLLDILRIGVQIAQGLAAAHSQGIVHRDVKPGNIMLVDESPRVKITDFGLARVTADNVDFTSGGAAVGTPGYMSPEQVRGEELDSRSDLFALGCVFYAMFTGHSPFHGRTIIEIARRIDSYEPPRLREIGRSVPEFMDALVFKLLRKQPEDRYQSAAEVADILNRHLALLNQTPTDRLPQAFQRQLMDDQRASERRSLVMSITIAAVVAAVVGASIFVVSQRLASLSTTESGEPAGVRPPVAQVIPEVPVITASGRRTLVVVNQAKTGDFTTLTEAVRNVAAGGTIRVTDDAVYEESLVLVDGVNLTNVRIVAEKGAVLRQREAVGVTIANINGLTLAGFTIEVPQNHWGIEVRGRCEGLILENLRIKRLDSEERETQSVASVFFRPAASGTAAAPIRLRNSRIENANVGIVCGSPNSKERLTQHLIVEGCRIQGSGRETATLIAIMATADHIVFRQNVIMEGVSGINLVVDSQRSPTECVLERNTWYGIKHWISWIGASPKPTESVRFRDNLAVDCDQISTNVLQWAGEHPEHFEGNVATRSLAPASAETAGTNQAPLFAPCAKWEDQIPFLSTDPASDKFLEPDGGRLRERTPAIISVPGAHAAPKP